MNTSAQENPIGLQLHLEPPVFTGLTALEKLNSFCFVLLFF